MLTRRQGCAHGGMRPHDAAESQLGAHSEEARQDCVFATEPRDDQRPETREARAEGGDEWRDDHADTAHAVSPHIFHFQSSCLSRYS